MAAFKSYKQRLEQRALWRSSSVYKFLYILSFITIIALVYIVIQPQSTFDPMIKLWILGVGLLYNFIFLSIIKPLLYRRLVKSGRISQKDIDDKVASDDKKMAGLSDELFNNK